MSWTDNIKIRLQQTAWVVMGLAFVVGFAVLLTSAAHKQAVKTCQGVEVKIEREHAMFFVDETDVRKILVAMSPDTFYSTPLSEIGLEDIEWRLEKDPHIKNAEAWIGMDGWLQISIDQTRPVMRIINNQAVSYYIDIYGQKLPLSSKFTPRVIVATGDLPDATETPLNPESGTKAEQDRKVLNELSELALFLEKEPFWNAQIEQLHRNKNGDYELVPKVGNHIIKLGNLEGYESKLDKLNTFYQEALNYVGWDRHETINLEYLNQVVCTLKEK